MATLNEWFERADRGTSGDMVFDILHDWKKDQEHLINLIDPNKLNEEKIENEIHT